MADKSLVACIVYEHSIGSNRFDIVGHEKVVFTGKIPSEYLIGDLAQYVHLDKRRAKNYVYRFLVFERTDNIVEIQDETFDYDELFLRGARKENKHPHHQSTSNRFTLDESVCQILSELFL